MTNLSKRQKRILQKQGIDLKTQEIQKNVFTIKSIKPLTNNQAKVFASYNNDQNLMIHGSAGTGKTFLALYLALNELMNEQTPFKKVIIIRSPVATRDIGHLPGDAKEKVSVYEAPYASNCSKLFGRGDAYEILKTKGLVEFIPTSHIRGTTYDNAIIIVDELQNMTWHEASSIITRAGADCKFIMAGDYKQSDLTAKNREDVKKIMAVCSVMESFDFIEMTVDDIVRSGLVREFYLAVEKKGISL